MMDRGEVIQRVKSLREGLQLSRREFGEVEGIVRRGQMVVIYTTKHTLTISINLWDDLGKMHEQAVVEHGLPPGIN